MTNARSVANRLVSELHDGAADKNLKAWAAEAAITMQRLCDSADQTAGAADEPPEPGSLVRFPSRLSVEREIQRTENPQGLQFNDGKERVTLPGGTLRHMLSLIDRYALRAAARPIPDFDAVRDKRMSELTPQQQRDAQELWIRKNLGFMNGKDHVEFLLARLDEARGTPAAAQPRPAKAEPLTLDNAPEGTFAPADMGGAWVRVARGWQWNGHTKSPGSTFPRPGGDWTGKLLSPEMYAQRYQPAPGRRARP